MIPPDLVPILLPVVQTLEGLGVAYQIGGSLASSGWGMPRSTQDADLVADLRLAHVAPFVARLENAYYLNDETIADAIRRRGSFNLIHLDTMFKIDVFIRKPQPFEDATFQRAQRAWIDDPPTQQAVFTSAEDIVLHKLVWYQMGGGVSERQWLDVLGVLKVRAAELDLPYLHTWGARLGVSDLLARAMEDAGLSP
jgi:hypothetical protein